MSKAITPNGTTGTLTEACFVEPQRPFQYENMNVLANNSACLCQRYTTMLSAYHYIRGVNEGTAPPRYAQSPFITTYVFMSAGSYNIAVSTTKNTTGHVVGSAYVGTMSIDGTVLCTFGTNGTSAIVPWTLTGDARWILVQAQVVAERVNQYIANDYWIGYRKVVTS